MFVFLISGIILLCLQIVYSIEDTNSLTSNDWIHKALYDISHPLGLEGSSKHPPSINYTNGESFITARCKGYLSCEWKSFYFAELHNVIFSDKKVNLLNLNSQTKASLDEMKRVKSSKPDEFRLPSMQLEFRVDSAAITPGLPVEVNSMIPKSVCDGQWLEESAFIYGPWHTHNSYHSVNDNIFSLLTHIYLQYQIIPETHHLLPMIYSHNINSPRSKSAIYNLFQTIFEENRKGSRQLIIPNSKLCIRHAFWGQAYKIIYLDSNVHLSHQLYRLFHTLAYYKFQKTSDHPSHFLSSSVLVPPQANNLILTPDKIPQFKKKAKVCIISRQDGANNPERMLATKTEIAMKDMFLSFGANAEVVYFNKGQSSKEYYEYFRDVDICIGIHGAGLMNCLLSEKPVVMVEFQTGYSFGFTEFSKIAHITRGHYISYDLRNEELIRANGENGYSLSSEVIKQTVVLTLSVLSYGQTQLTTIHEKMNAQADLNAFTNYISQKRSQSKKPLTHILEDPKYISSLLYSGEIIMNMKTKKYYSDKKHSKNINDIWYDEHFLSFAKPADSLSLSESSFKKIDLQEHPLIVGINKQFDVMSEHASSNIEDLNKLIPQHPNIFHFSYQSPRDHQEFRIFLNPYLYFTHPDNIWGPETRLHYEHCVQLPYFKMELMNYMFRDIMGFCDSLGDEQYSGDNRKQEFFKNLLG